MTTLSFLGFLGFLGFIGFENISATTIALFGGIAFVALTVATGRSLVAKK